MIAPDLLAELRAQTPGLTGAVHLNHGGASLMPQASLQAIHAHLQLESQVGAMEAALLAADRLQAMREDAARLIHASSDEIAFMTSGSSAFGSVFAALPAFKPGERILVSRQEWGGNLANYQRVAQRTGAVIEIMPCHADGSVDAAALANCIDRRVRLLSLTWLPANGGLINDAVAVGKVARAAGIPYIVDAAQALGQIPVDVQALQCDVLKSACRKHLRGPRGTALLYVRKSFLAQLQPAWVDVSSAPIGTDGMNLRDDARCFETSEVAAALLLGLAESMQLALKIGVENIASTTAALAQALRQRLARIPAVSLHDLGAGDKSGLVSFNLKGYEAMELKQRLAQERIYIGANGISYTPLDMQSRGLHSIARASLSYLNTEEDIERLAAALEKMV